MFVGILHSAGVYSLHTVEVDQSAQNWFYRAAASLGEKAHVVFIFIEFFVYFVVQRFVDAVFNLFELRDLATAGFPKRTVLKVLLAAAVAWWNATEASRPNRNPEKTDTQTVRAKPHQSTVAAQIIEISH